jgi:pilus assembly protein Flp/PilA
MFTYLNVLLALKTDRRAVTALEYGLIAALVGGAIITSVTLLGTDIGLLFTNIAGKVAAAT